MSVIFSTVRFRAQCILKLVVKRISKIFTINLSVFILTICYGSCLTRSIFCNVFIASNLVAFFSLQVNELFRKFFEFWITFNPRSIFGLPLLRPRIGPSSASSLDLNIPIGAYLVLLVFARSVGYCGGGFCIVVCWSFFFYLYFICPRYDVCKILSKYFSFLIF